MSPKVEYGSHGTIESPLYNPTPPYNGDPQSPYHKSCQVSCLYRYGFSIINMVQTAVLLDCI